MNETISTKKEANKMKKMNDEPGEIIQREKSRQRKRECVPSDREFRV